MGKHHPGGIVVRLSRRQLAFLAALLLTCAAALRLESETLVMTTYYPSPLGVYNKLTSTGNTILARDGGNVGIGTTNPTQKLQVQGGAIWAQGGFILETKISDPDPSTLAVGQMYIKYP